MKALRQDERRQLEQFLATLFLPDELIELRFIESWFSRGKRRSRVARAAAWLRSEEFVSRHRDITQLAKHERANVYFGVCPRPKEGDSQDDQIRTVRCLWCDIDDVTAEVAFERWNEANVPRPSIVVSSGSGIHAYWLLDRDVRSREDRSLITALLPHFYRSFGGDHVQNLSRILRPPGTVNCKDARNGRPRRPCTLLKCRPNARYSLEAFDRWITMTTQEQRQAQARRATVESTQGVPSEEASACKVKVTEIIRNLDKPSQDRSRRDFAVVCDLLRLGLTAEDIWPLVAGSSKFESNGRPYFDVTVANAERTILFDSTSVGRPKEPT